MKDILIILSYIKKYITWKNLMYFNLICASTTAFFACILQNTVFITAPLLLWTIAFSIVFFVCLMVHLILLDFSKEYRKKCDC